MGAKWGLPYAAPLSFLTVRYMLVLVVLLMAILYARVPFPREKRQWLHLGVAGLMIQGGYLAGVFLAVSVGLPAGMAALIVGLQPLFTAFGAGMWLQEKISPRQWLGLIAGVVGVALVVSPKIGADFAWSACGFAVFALFCITLGTLYQKKYCAHFDWRSGAFLQFLPSLLVTAPLAWYVEGFAVQWKSPFLVALAWLVLVLSIGAIGLLNYLIRSGSAVNVSRLFYLTPACTAIIAWWVFGETMNGQMVAGMAVAIAGVVLARGR